MTKVSNFEKVLDSVEALSVDEQETLIKLVGQRLGREEIATNIAQARAEYQTGQAFRGTVEEVIAELGQ
jgi:hypothetical protein